ADPSRPDTDRSTTASIDKLRITGIRSFDNTRAEVIHFQTPLTLIVGYNGSGKTSIIECLKYATTGESPPNSKNGGFVHDPKLCGEKEVMAQVKLQCKDMQGNKVVITRSLKSSVTSKGTVSTNALDNNLMFVKNGIRESISNKKATLDEAVFTYLGVSSAILEYVIFCHQEDSMWPMNEPTALKKKFDEIFDASAYIRAIVNLKDLRKAKNANLKSLEQTAATEKINKEKADRALKKSAALEKEIYALKASLDEITAEIEAAAADKVSKRNEAKKASTASAQLQAKTTQANFLESNITELKSYLEELQESDEWLENTLTQYAERLAQYEQQELEYTTHYSQLQNSLKGFLQQLSQKQAEKGQHKAEKETYERNVERRAQMVKQAASRHAMRGFEGDLEADQIQDFVSRIAKASKHKDRELERIRKTTNDELQQAQATINDLKQRQASETQAKVYARQTISKNDKEFGEKQQQMKAISMDEGGKAALQTSRNDLEERLQRMTAEYDSAAWDSNIMKEKSRLSDLREESTRLFNELSQNTKQSSARAQLDLAKRSAKEQQSSLDTLKATHNGEFMSLVGADWRTDTLDREFHTVMDHKARDVANAKKEHELVKEEYNKIDFKLNASREDLKKKKEAMRKCEDAVRASILQDGETPLSSIDDYPTELKSIQDDRNEVQKFFNGADYVSDFWESCVGYLHKYNGCKVCARPFANEKEKSSLLQKLQKKLATQAKAEYEEKLEDLDACLRKANEARSHYDTYKTLSAEVPRLESEFKKLETAKASALAGLEEHDSLLNEAESAKRDVDTLSETVRAISQCISNIAKHEGEVTRLSSQSILSGSSRSTDEIREQSSTCDEQIRALETKIGKISGNKEQATTAKNDLEKEVEGISRQLQSADHMLERKHALSSRIEELRESSNQLRDDIRRADAELNLLAPQLDKATAQHEKVQQRGRSKENEIQKDKNALSDTVNQLTIVEDSINTYIEEGGPGKLASCQRAIKNIEQEQSLVQSEVAEVTQKANDMKKLRSESDKIKRNMQDNIKYRGLLRDLKLADSEIAELKKRSIREDWEQLERDADKADRFHQNLLGKRGPIAGQIVAKNGELEGYAIEWETDYRHAEKNFREAQIRATTTKAAVEDIAKCTKAVDNAIMRYHSVKMEEINAFAGDLWQKTYQGTDIDTILIRSESDDSTSTTAVRTNHKYRVVMVKQDTEMDMRGRCSAGQKVLACIIIRLALAECFGVNCGVIALDEPTTNLDQDNIKALATSLHDIIQARKHQANFQLIVITHDEEFLKAMNCSEFTEYYYRVSRDEKQKSMIEQQSITEFF
ncbi:DNA repair protein RAD50, partial [Lachnellula suecica]